MGELEQVHSVKVAQTEPEYSYGERRNGREQSEIELAGIFCGGIMKVFSCNYYFDFSRRSGEVSRIPTRFLGP